MKTNLMRRAIVLALAAALALTVGASALFGSKKQETTQEE